MILYFRLIWVFFRVGILNEMAYRANFFIQILESLLGLSTGLLGMELVFFHTHTLGGWSQMDILTLLGVYMLMGGIIQTVIQPSMQRLMEDVRQGTLDFTLTKPEDGQLLISIAEIRVWKLADVGLGLGIIAVALSQRGMNVSIEQAVTFGLMLITGGTIIYSFWLILATCTFWFIRVENILVIFQSMYQAGRWPIGIYPNWLKLILTFLVPVAFAITVPAEAITGRLSGSSLGLSLVLATGMIIFSRWFWRLGVKNYSGASS